MKISEIQAKLEELKAVHGDVECGFLDADTGWEWVIADKDFMPCQIDGNNVIMIGGDYDSDNLRDSLGIKI